MKINSKQSFAASAIAFLLATSCCWLPWLAVILGGAGGMAVLGEGMEKYSGILMMLGLLLFALGAWQIYRNKKGKAIVLKSTVSCPECKHKKEEEMPENACQFFYECENCKKVLKPLKGDCCVYCSYGTVPCPPIQKDEDCCA
jgi:hypothetical protein